MIYRTQPAKPRPGDNQVRNLNFQALRSLGNLADYEPVIIVDSRELVPLSFPRLKTQVGTLQTGDYSIGGMEELFSVERKSISDLVGCCMGESRERFERELHRLRGFRFKRILIEGSRDEIELQHYSSRITPKAVLATLSAFEVRYDCPVVFAPTLDGAATMVEQWVYYFAREYVQTVNDLFRSTKRNSPTDESMSE
jgi:DNA excision repair protein ERCC-4